MVNLYTVPAMLSTTDSDWPEVVGTPAWSAALLVVFIPNTISDSPNTWQIQNQASFLWVSILLVIMEALLSTVATNVSVCGLRLDRGEGGGGLMPLPLNHFPSIATCHMFNLVLSHLRSTQTRAVTLQMAYAAAVEALSWCLVVSFSDMVSNLFRQFRNVLPEFQKFLLDFLL